MTHHYNPLKQEQQDEVDFAFAEDDHDHESDQSFNDSCEHALEQRVAELENNQGS